MCTSAGISVMPSALTAIRFGSHSVSMRSAHGPRNVTASSSGAVTSQATRQSASSYSVRMRPAVARIQELSYS